MTEKQARLETKYLGAGVRVGIWSYTRDGQWEIVIQRGAQIDFTDFDGLGRAILDLLSRASSGAALQLWRSHSSYSDDAFIEFSSFDDAKECVREINRALVYLRTRCKDERWRPIPVDIFELFDSVAQCEKTATGE